MFDQYRCVFHPKLGSGNFDCFNFLLLSGSIVTSSCVEFIVANVATVIVQTRSMPMIKRLRDQRNDARAKR
jgi:hypothetical protein